MREITRLQVSAARYANPLTLLPGNVPINEHIDRLLRLRRAFRRLPLRPRPLQAVQRPLRLPPGDDMIQLAARILVRSPATAAATSSVTSAETISCCCCRAPTGPALRDRRWSGSRAESRAPVRGAPSSSTAVCWRRIARATQLCIHCSALSIGAVVVEPRELSPRTTRSAQAAAEAKRQAKRAGGNRLFVERRSGRPGRVSS